MLQPGWAQLIPACFSYECFIKLTMQDPTTSPSTAIISWGTASYSNPAIDVTLLVMAALSPQIWRSVSSRWHLGIIIILQSHLPHPIPVILDTSQHSYWRGCTRYGGQHISLTEEIIKNLHLNTFFDHTSFDQLLLIEKIRHEKPLFWGNFPDFIFLYALLEWFPVTSRRLPDSLLPVWGTGTHIFNW